MSKNLLNTKSIQYYSHNIMLISVDFRCSDTEALSSYFTRNIQMKFS